jgi:hypothetical protein
MQKDIIYIDVEDDITAIIGKVKSAKQKIVAVVPPKHVGVLQSAVNMRLLARSAEQNNKRLVLISNNPALASLAGAAKIPVAKNLQSKPELAEIPALEIDDGDDVIDGGNLPIGEHAKTAKASTRIPVSGMLNNKTNDTPVDEISLDDTPRAVPPVPGVPAQRPRIKNGPKVPNFNTFRKKLILGIGGGIVLVVFLVWAFFFAPQATVYITAKTSDSAANLKVSLSDNADTSYKAGTIKTNTVEIKKDATISFDATGKKDVGDKSKGQIVFKNCETATAQTIPAGTVITANGMSYTTQASAAVSAGIGGFAGCVTPGSSDPITIVASDIGADFDTPNGTTFSVAGHANSSSAQYFRATASTDINGGTKKQVTVVSSADIQKASEQLTKQNSDDIKKQLTSKLGDNTITLTTSFKADQQAATSVPAVDTESTDGKAKLTSSVTYTMAGVAKSEVSRYLDDYFASQIKDSNDRRVYSNGANKVSFMNVSIGDNGYSGSVTTTGKIGPKIDDNNVKATAKGKRYGDIQSSIQAIQGVDNVDIKFWPFWVNTAPNDTKKINIVFKLDESK